MNIVIAGVSGFLGGRIKKFFENKNYKIFDYRKKLPNKINFIINVAGPDSDYCKKYPKKSQRDRIKINKDILKIIKKKRVDKYLYISTMHVYKMKTIIDENTNLNFDNAYARSHIEAEKFVKKKFKNICEFQILRVSNCFGAPHKLLSNSWKLVINNIVKNAFTKKKIIIKSNNDFYKDYIGISFFLRIIDYYLSTSSKKNIINISSENSKSILQVCRIIKQIYFKNFKQNIQLKYNFTSVSNKQIIKSKFINKKIKEKCNYFFLKDMEELILFCSKFFKK